MTTFATSPGQDIYDPDAVVPQNSPLLVPQKVNTRPSPSPEPEIPLVQVSPPSRHRNGKAKRAKVRPSQGDAVLIGIMGEGRDPEIATTAGLQALPSDSEEGSSSPGSESSTDDGDVMSDSTNLYVHAKEPRIVQIRQRGRGSPVPNASLANTALAALALGDHTSVSDDGKTPSTQEDAEAEAPRTNESPASTAPRPQTAARRDPADRPQPLVPAPYSPNSYYSPRTGSFASPTASVGHGELPPIQNASPRSESNGGISLPSLKQQLGVEALSPPSFPISPPGMPPVMPRLPSISSHASPPISPHELIPRSPHHPIMPPSPYYPFPPNGLAHRPSMDYSGSTPSDHSVSTPATSGSVADRMHIEGAAFHNPAEHGQYVCNFEGCKAPPFQTQYLLNSHANVHSQSRPHYCPVKGCSRSEGGKGFKRKNEMIRHGLVHESPGYVCPFCPDREHKYPRPDNLQRFVAGPQTGYQLRNLMLIALRHVRVHHPDKDKDDALLRDVLSQRPDGPSRGRRRRAAS